MWLQLQVVLRMCLAPVQAGQIPVFGREVPAHLDTRNGLAT